MSQRRHRDRPGTVGRYRVSAVLGSGSFGTVYLGRDPTTGSPVAVKVLDRSRTDDTGSMTALRSEADAMRRIQNRHCVRVIDVVDEPDITAIVTELIDGASLRAVLARAGRLTGPQALDVMRGALLGLTAVHTAGLVHGDIKPDNVLVDRQGVSRLIDFGLARQQGAVSVDGSVAGSPAYMSPEQIKGYQVTGRSDIYACAAVLFELLTGRRPYEADRVVDVARMHLNAPVPDPRELRPTLSADLAQLCMAGLAKDPADRYATAAQFLAALEEAAQQRYGAAWRTGLGLGALAGAAVAAVITQGTAQTAAAPPSATANPGTAPPQANIARHPTMSAARRIGRLSRGIRIGGSAAAAAAVTTTVVIVIATHTPTQQAAPARVATAAARGAPTSLAPTSAPGTASSALPIPPAVAHTTVPDATATRRAPTTRPTGPARTSSPTTTAAAAVHPTRVVLFQPWTARGPAGLSIPARGTQILTAAGACDEGSPDDPGRADAFRCTSAGLQIPLGPCFVNPSGDPGSALLCVADPTMKQVVSLIPNPPVPVGRSNPNDPTARAWFLILADGRKCHLAGTGTNTDVLPYDCGDGIAATVPNRTRPIWAVREARYQPGAAPASPPVAVTSAFR